MHLSPDQTINSSYNIYSEQPFDYSNSCFVNNHDIKKFFHEGFVPRQTDVIIGKGMKAFSHFGNEKLRDTIASRLQEYENMTTKKERSDAISSIVAETKLNGFFLKKDINTGLWFEADEVLARDKISQTFRKLKSENRDESSQALLSCNSSRRMSSLNRPQSIAISDRMSSINSVDLAKKLRSCVPVYNFEEDSSPYEPIGISEPFAFIPSEAISMSICYDKLDRKHNRYEPIPYRYTSSERYS